MVAELAIGIHDDLGAGLAQRLRPVIAPGDADGADAGRPRHRHVEGRIADHDAVARRGAGLGERLLEHGRMRLRGVIVGGLDGREDALPAVPLEEMRNPAAGLAGRDAEDDLVTAGKLREKLGGARKERLAIGGVGPQPLKGGLVALGKALRRPVGDEHAHRLRRATGRRSTASARGSAARGREPERPPAGLRR